MSCVGTYYVAFDLARSGFRNWTFAAFGLIFAFIGCLLVFTPNLMQRVMPGGLQGKFRKIFSWVFLTFAVAWTAVVFIATTGQYRSLKSAEDHGYLRVVQGVVKNFHPMPYTGHAMETFEVNGVHFSYSDYVSTAAFNNTAAHGGPIREGLPVRISYVGNAIVRLEICE